MPQLDELSAQLDRLAAFEPGPYPVISLYLNLQPDARGRDSFEPFLRKELGGRVDTYAAPEHESLQRDAERITAYLETIDRSANGLALFACDGAGLFEAFQLAASIASNRLCVSSEPHLYPLALLLDEYRLACVGLDSTRSALELGQVDELVIAGSPDAIGGVNNKKLESDRTPHEQAADSLIAGARNTSAAIRFIEDASIAASIGGVGAFLRFKS